MVPLELSQACEYLAALFVAEKEAGVRADIRPFYVTDRVSLDRNLDRLQALHDVAIPGHPTLPLAVEFADEIFGFLRI